MFGKIKEICSRIKRIWELPDAYEKRFRNLAEEITETNNRIGEHTIVHADINFKNASQVIVIGKYKNHDYVRVFDVNEQNLNSLIDMLRSMEKNAKVGRFDMPGGMPNLSVVYPRERF